MDLAELRKSLESQIRDGQLPEALQSLLAQLPDDSETYRIVSALIARLNAANKERYRNTIAFEEYQRRIDQVSADFFDLLSGLKEADFAPSSAKVPGKKGKTGSVLYHVPQWMRIQIPTRCTIRVAVSENEILENIVLDKFLKVKNEVEISDVMSAELLDPEGGTFKISPLNARTQLVKDSGYTEWIFQVTPLIDGVHQLLVKVSILEVVPGFAEPIPREVSVMETVTIVTESASEGPGRAAESNEEVSQRAFKSTGQTFGFQSASTAIAEPEINYSKAVEQPSLPPASPPQASRSGNPALRALALFLGFLILAPAATWAFTPPVTRDWWVATIKDSPEAYASYIATYRQTDSPYLEKAYYLKAERTDQLADLRAYQDKYQFNGKYASRVMSRVEAHESSALESIRKQPNVVKIRQFAADFPESERLTDVKQAVEGRQENRQELLAEVENAYVSSVKAKPTEAKVVAYLRDFPKQDRLNEVEEAIRTKPEIFKKVQPALEDAFLKKMEQNPTEQQSEQFLEKFPEPVQREKFEKILDKKPAIKQKAVTKMKRLEAARREQ